MRQPNADGNGYGNSYSDGDAYSYCYCNVYANPDSDGDGNGNADGNGDGAAEAYTDAAAAADAPASPVGLIRTVKAGTRDRNSRVSRLTGDRRKWHGCSRVRLSYAFRAQRFGSAMRPRIAFNQRATSKKRRADARTRRAGSAQSESPAVAGRNGFSFSHRLWSAA